METTTCDTCSTEVPKDSLVPASGPSVPDAMICEGCSEEFSRPPWER